MQTKLKLNNLFSLCGERLGIKLLLSKGAYTFLGVCHSFYEGVGP